jgi:hypothetical protein
MAPERERVAEIGEQNGPSTPTRPTRPTTARGATGSRRSRGTGCRRPARARHSQSRAT